MKRIIIFSYLLVMILFMDNFAFADNSDKTETKKMQIEFYLGQSRDDTDGLKIFPEYNFMNNHQGGLRKYAYYSDVSNNYTYDRRTQGEFEKIEAAMPFGIRLKYFINPKFALSVGFTTMNRTAASMFTDKFEVSYLDPDYTPFYREFIDEATFDPATISFASYVLHVGNHHIFVLNRVWSVEVFASVGLGYASCLYEDRITSNIKYLSEDSLNEYWEERLYVTEYKGDGITFFSELGGRVNIQWHKKISFFLEMTGNYLDFKNISGPGKYSFSYKDANGEGYQSIWEGEGKWKVREIIYNNSWGYFNESTPYIDDGDSNDRKFALNLSGFQFRFGIAYRF